MGPMPANLTPQYREAEERFRAAATREEKQVALREMMALLPKHKGTEKLQADIRRRMARLEEEAEQGAGAGPAAPIPGTCTARAPASGCSSARPTRASRRC